MTTLIRLALKALRRWYYGRQPDRTIFKDIGIPDNMPILPAQRPLILWMKKRGLPRLMALWGAVAAIVVVVAGIVSMFR